MEILGKHNNNKNCPMALCRRQRWLAIYSRQKTLHVKGGWSQRKSLEVEQENVQQHQKERIKS